MDASKTIPTGNVCQIISFRGEVIPFGFLLCDGSYVLRSDYARLFESIGTTYNLGGDVDVTKFRLPNIIDKMTICQSSDFALGISAGSNTETLTTNQIPSHTHLQNAHTHSTLNYVNNIIFSSGSVSSLMNTNFTNTSAHTATNQNTGGGLAHNNIMPSLYCFKIIKF